MLNLSKITKYVADQKEVSDMYAEILKAIEVINDNKQFMSRSEQVQREFDANVKEIAVAHKKIADLDAEYAKRKAKVDAADKYLADGYKIKEKGLDEFLVHEKTRKLNELDDELKYKRDEIKAEKTRLDSYKKEVEETKSELSGIRKSIEDMFSLRK